MRTLPFVFAFVFVSACGHTGYRAPLTCPEHGGPAWTEVASPHFRVLTDQSPAVAERISHSLEETWAAFEKLWGVGMVGRGAPTGRVDFVAFDRKEDFVEVSSLPRSKAIFCERQTELDPQPTIVSWGPLGENARNVLQHELAHRFVRNTIQFAPVWLNEGLAEYFSTFELIDGVARFGKRPYRLVNVAGSIDAGWVERLPSLEKLLGTGWGAFHDENDERYFYPAAWGLVHYFEHTADLRPRFRDYQRRLANGEEPLPAFDAAFEGVDRARIDREFHQQARDPGVAVLEGRFSATVAPSSPPRRLGDAEVHVLYAWLRPLSRSGLPKIRAELDEAARLEPRSGMIADARAWFELRSGHIPDAEDAAHRAVELAPSEPQFQLTLAQTLLLRTMLTPAPRDWKPLRALLKPLWPSAKTAPELNLIAGAYAQMGEPDLALPFAKKAVETDPACWICLHTLARVLADTGFVEEALPLEERAVALLPEHVKIPAMLKKLDEYRKQVASRPKP